ncbi:hypothetical protein [Hugenholtzia roseola]|uniref:hypothetical protein n=1 Tax=Hugenholtzia roseola TaxID=1002 RepID=UPI00041BEA36|nr:hypothetical protein [Hugenholtzia roseola]
MQIFDKGKNKAEAFQAGKFDKNRLFVLPFYFFKPSTMKIKAAELAPQGKNS